MITKSCAKNGKTCKVTFKVAPELAAEKGAVMGDFNDWKEEANPLAKRKDGSLTTTVSLGGRQGTLLPLPARRQELDERRGAGRLQAQPLRRPGLPAGGLRWSEPAFPEAPRPL